MNVLIAIPGISHDLALKSRALTETGEFVEIGKFTPTLATLDVFPQEMHNLSVPGFWSIGIPHWPLEATGTHGVAGPGLPKEELFVPEEIKEDMEELCGAYDKWRPYPAEAPLTSYMTKIARKFSTKRGKAFEHIVQYVQWETIFWVEHAPTSLVHLDEEEALGIMDRLLFKAFGPIRSHASATFVCFSPYGLNGEPGFVISNRLEVSKVSNWNCIRKFLNGKLDK